MNQCLKSLGLLFQNDIESWNNLPNGIKEQLSGTKSETKMATKNKEENLFNCFVYLLMKGLFNVKSV